MLSLNEDSLDGGTGQDATLAEKCREFGAMLGMDGPVSAQVLQAATQNPGYAPRLYAARHSPQKLAALLENPPETEDSEDREITSLQLVRNATQALWHWGKSGFSYVNDVVLDRREQACLCCPELRAPTKKLQKLVSKSSAEDVTGQRLGNSVCSICGCGMKKKIRLSSSSCPDPHPDKEGLSRWSEPIRK